MPRHKEQGDQSPLTPERNEGDQIANQIRNIFRTDYLRSIFLVSLAIAIVFPVVDRVFIIPLFIDFVIDNTEEDAQRAAKHLQVELEIGKFGEGEVSLPAYFTNNAPEIIAALGLMKIKVYSPSGEIIYSTDIVDIGILNKNDYFLNIVAQGHLLTQLTRRDTPSLEGEIISQDVVETYVPIMGTGEAKNFLGAFELYFDVTDRMAKVDRLLNLSSYILAAVALGLLLAVVWTLRSAVAASTERDNAERALMVANMTLEKNVKERTWELKIAKDRAENASLSKSEFLANMSHELRTPLNSVIGFSETLIHGTFGPLGCAKNEEYVADIHKSGKFLLELINDILDISRIEAGELGLEEEDVDITAVIEGVIILVKEHAEKGRVQIYQNNQSPNCNVLLDPRQFKQILLNLLSNGIKFTNPGGVVTISNEICADGAFVLRVEDTGIGIDPEHQALVLEPFGQVAGLLTRHHQGIGLGLPIVKALVANHDGEFNLESEEGKGTTVIITFPKVRVLSAS